MPYCACLLYIYIFFSDLLRLLHNIDCWTFIFEIFTYYVCLFWSHIDVNIIEFDATVIQVRGLATLKHV